jgi:WD40 repeat protein
MATLLVCSSDSLTLWDLRSSTVLASYRDGGAPALRALASLPAPVCRGQAPWPAAFALAQASAAAVLQYAWGSDTPLFRCAVAEPLGALAASADGSLLAGGGASGRLYLWDAATGELAREWQAHYKAASCLAFSPCGALLASGGLDGVAHCWDVAALLDVSSSSSSSSSGAALPPAASATWSGHTMALTHLAFAPLGGLCGGPAAARLVTCSLDRSVRWWDVASGRCLRTVALPTGATALCADGAGATWYVGGLNGSIYVLGASASGSASGGGGAPAGAAMVGHTAAVTCLAVTPDGDRVLSGGDDGSVRIWSAQSRQQIGALGSASAAASVASSSASASAASSASGGGSASKRSSIAALLLLPTRPPALLQQGRGGASSAASGAQHHPLPLPAIQPLRKHPTFSADALAASSSSSSSSTGGRGAALPGPRLSVLRLRATGERSDAGVVDAAMHAAVQQVECAAAAVAAAAAGGSGSGGTGGSGGASAAAAAAAPAPAAAAPAAGEVEELRSKVATLEAENARWKAVAGRLLAGGKA